MERRRPVGPDGGGRAALAVRRERAGTWISTDALEEGVVVFGADGSVQASNSAADRILGMPFADFLARLPDGGLLTEDGKPFPPGAYPATLAIRHGRVVTGVVMGFVTPDGTRRWITA